MRLSRPAFCALVERALAGLPAQFEQYMEELSVDVEDQPDARTLAALELDDPRSLLGMYQGHPLTERSLDHTAPWPERIVIYQANVQRICRSRSQIIDQVRKTVLHEVGHHFGLDEADLDELGYA